MKKIDTLIGKKVEKQGHFNGYCSMLFGRLPEKMDILCDENCKDLVIFDGRCWREFHPDENDIEKAE